MKLRRSSGIEALHSMWITRAAAAALQERFEQAHQIFGFFLDLDVAVAQDAQQARALDRVPGKEPVEIQLEHMLERQEARRCDRGPAGG